MSDKLSDHERSCLAAFQRERDNCALKLGVADYEHAMVRAQLVRSIQESLRQEKALAREFLACHGANPETDRIDPSTGEIVRTN